MDMNLSDGIKKFVLMGIGAAAMTAEKSQQMVDELVKKGEITVEQGKELNQELKRSVKKSMEEASDAVDEKEAEIDKKTVAFEDKIKGMTAEELDNLKKLIAEAEKAVKEEE